MDGNEARLRLLVANLKAELEYLYRLRQTLAERDSQKYNEYVKLITEEQNEEQESSG